MSEERTIEELELDTREKRVIDIRSRDSFIRGAYPGAENIPPEELDTAALAASDKPIYLMCQIGRQSLELAGELRALGCEAYSVSGGYASYLLRRMDAMAADEEKRKERRQRAERSIIKTYRKELWGPFTKALNVYKLVNPGDRIAVCISGGKDSMLMAKLFQELLAHGERNFEAVFLVMDPGYNEVNYRAVTENARLLGVPIRTFRTEIFDIVAQEDMGSPCYLCARMRRGYLYSKAKELGCNKIALGHHFDDVIETTLMSMLYGGQIQTMLPKLHSKNFPGMELIRPLYLIREADIVRWRNYNDLHFIQCACRLTESCASCGGTEQGSKRAEIKRLIARLKEDNPQVESSIFRSVENVCLDAVIAYKQNGVKHHFLDDYGAENEN